MAKGYLIVNVYTDNIALPVENSRVTITSESTSLEYFTDINGKTERITLDAPEEALSQTEQNQTRPYSTYTVTVEKEGLTKVTVENVEIYPEVVSYQDVYLTNESITEEDVLIKIDPPTLWGDYPPTVIAEKEDTSFAPYVLKQVVVPEYIVVHDGIPSNKNAADYTVRFTDYIKNVACSEIYSTWPKETLKANILAIISFTLNRIFTEWYISRGYDFTITSTTTYDQKYTRGRTIFEPIANVVDEIFTNYIRVGNYPQPLLAHYQADTAEDGYLSQWGSKYLGDRGYTAKEILQYYYGNNINIYNAEVVVDYPSSYNGVLQLNDCGENVQILQNELNFIRGSYPAITQITDTDGYFRESTRSAVLDFQKIFDLPQTGVVDFATWYRISYIYVSVSDMLKSVY